MDLDAYRQSAETFTEELLREYYRHHAGLQDTFEIEPIYARHADLFARDAVETLREVDEGASANPSSRPIRRRASSTCACLASS